ncbi:ATP-binding protein, partial [Alicyclobacillus sendaiensis PA2]|nr:ATP-binding protein [Alicyclobacillus sendaiensis PA2]
MHFRVTCDDKGNLALWLGGSETRLDAMRDAFLQRCSGADAQAASLPEMHAQVERKLRRVGVLGGWLSTDAELEPVLDALQPGVTLDIAFASRPQDAWTAPIRAALEGKGTSSSSRLLKTFFESPPSDESRKKEKETREERMRRERLEKALAERTTYYQVEITVTGPDARSVDAVVDELNIQLRHDHHLTARPAQGEETIALWREEELSCLVRMPNLAAAVGKRIPALQAGEVLLRDDELTEGIAVGRLIHPLKEARLVFIPESTIVKHFAAFGKNGSGKSSLIVLMNQSLFERWVRSPIGTSPGATFVDPAGSTITILINRLLELERQGYPVDWSRVHYFKLGDSEYPVGLNLLYKGGLDEASVAANVLALIHTAYGGETVFTDRLIENALRTLMMDPRRQHTILGLTAVLQYPALRESIPIDDPLVQEFWETTGEELKPRQLDPLFNRLRPLLGNQVMRRIFGQAEFSLQIRKWMDEG